MAGIITRFISWIRNNIRKLYSFIRTDIRKRPLVNFYLALFIFVLIVVLSSVLQAPPKAKEVKNPAKSVSLYYIGSVPKLKVSAQIEKTGVVKVVALSGGVVQKINYKEGDNVTKGNTLISLSTNYQGGNTMSVQRQLANNQYQSAVDTYDLQKNIIQGQRDVATTSADNANKMRDLSNASRDRTRQLIDINKAFLENLDNQLKAAQPSNIPTPTGGLAPVNPNPGPSEIPNPISVIQAQRAQLLAGLAQAEGSLASLDYQADSDKPPAELARLQEDLTLKQLDLQEKMLGVNKEAARLQLQLAQVTEALMYPSSPISGVVQRIFVHEGDVVSPGTQLAVVSQNDGKDSTVAVAYVPADIAGKISKAEDSILTAGEKQVKESPYFISGDAVTGNSYAVYYTVPDDFAGILTDRGYMDIEIPIGYADTTAAAAYVPIDSVYQSESEAYLFVDEKKKAKSRRVELGNVYGGFVEVKKGLRDGDQVILTRNVVDGDGVEILK